MENEKITIEYLLQYAAAFSSSVGVRLSLCGLYGECYDEHELDCCKVCPYNTERRSEKTSCDVHLFGILQAYQQKKQVEYDCLCGFSFSILPVQSEKNQLYFLRLGAYYKEEKKENVMEAENIRAIPILSKEEKAKLTFLLSVFNIIQKESFNTLNTEQRGYIEEMLSVLQSFHLPQKKDYFEKQTKLLVKLLEQGEMNQTAVNGKLNEILGYLFFGFKASFLIIRAKVVELLLLLVENSVYETKLDEIYHIHNNKELYFWLSENMGVMVEYALRISSAKHTDTIKNAVEYMQMHFSQRISLEEVAANIYLSPTYFSKIFREHTGVTFSSYLNRLRVQKSKLLLQKTEQPLLKIAKQCGFEDDSYFSKVFKRYTQITPKQYQKEWARENNGGDNKSNIK